MNWLVRTLIFTGPIVAGLLYFDLDWKVGLFVYAVNVWGYVEGATRR